MGDNETERDGTVQSVITEQGDVNTYRFNTCFIKCEVSYSAAISCANINIYLAFLKLPRTNTHWHCCLASLFALVRTLKPRFFAILFLVKCLLHFHTFAFNCALCFLFLWILCCVALLLTWLIRLPNRWPQNETNKSGPQHTRTRDSGWENQKSNCYKRDKRAFTSAIRNKLNSTRKERRTERWRAGSALSVEGKTREWLSRRQDTLCSI